MGNLLFRDYGKHAYTIYCRSTQKGVRVYFHGKGIPEDVRENRSQLAAWILAAADDSMLSVMSVSIAEPEPARIMDSVPCAYCAENVMASRIRQRHDKPACIPCYEWNGVTS